MDVLIRITDGCWIRHPLITTPHIRNGFILYRSNDGGSVSLGDDHPCLVAEVGTIRVRMFDEVVRTLSNVKHIPELKKNLISLGYLEENGYAFSCQSGSGCLRITKGAMVMMKG